MMVFYHILRFYKTIKKQYAKSDLKYLQDDDSENDNGCM